MTEEEKKPFDSLTDMEGHAPTQLSHCSACEKTTAEYDCHDGTERCLHCHSLDHNDAKAMQSGKSKFNCKKKNNIIAK